MALGRLFERSARDLRTDRPSFDVHPLPHSPNSSERLPEKGNLILLKTAEGVKAIAIDRIQEVTFPHSHKPAAASEEFRNLLHLKLDWGKTKPAKSANVGLFYLQKGVRWIPSYKIELDGKGSAAVKLQATLLNELADLEDVSVNLVIGVPTFAFKDTVDPMAIQQRHHGPAEHPRVGFLHAARPGRGRCARPGDRGRRQERGFVRVHRASCDPEARRTNGSADCVIHAALQRRLHARAAVCAAAGGARQGHLETPFRRHQR